MSSDVHVAPRKRQVRTAFTGLVLALLLAALDQTIVATALPTIAGELRGLEHLGWVVTAYLLAMTVTMPIYGKLGDTFGRAPLLVFAIVLFLIGSALCGVAQSMEQLIAFRALQGLGGGGLMVGAQAAIGDLVSPRQRGRYQGVLSAVIGTATVVGPLLGAPAGADDGRHRLRAHLRVPDHPHRPLQVLSRRRHRPRRRRHVPAVHNGRLDEPAFEADFLPCSFGFRPKRAQHDALQVLIDEAWRGRRWAVETDVANCFSAIPHEKLMQAVEERVCDQAVLKLLRAMLRAGVMSDGVVRREVTGTPRVVLVPRLRHHNWPSPLFDRPLWTTNPPRTAPRP